MKKLIIVLSASIILLICGIASAGQFVSGSTGADGPFNPAADIELQLPPDGVFNYTTVNIPSYVTVTFKKNAANTPVYILATGDVTIAGTIHVDGTAGNGIIAGKGGTGGFDGGFGGTQNVFGGKGIGPGGGTPSANDITGGNGGAFAGSYGNDRILPLIGGSGGGGGYGGSWAGGAGGGGGGAILIASSTTINVAGTITANGGVGAGGYCGAGGGSGGAIKLMANTIMGNGAVSAAGGAAGVGRCYWAPWAQSCRNIDGTVGGSGRIRLEANTFARSSGTTPAYTYAYPGSVFVANLPSLQITSVAGVNVPATPTGLYETPDISLPSTTTNPVAIALSASNIPLNTTITVSIIPQFGSATNSVSSPLSGTLAASTAAASVTLANTYPYVITATATFTVQIAMYFDGEKIDKVRVASTMGKGSEVTYITETGKEIPAEKLMASLVR